MNTFKNVRYKTTEEYIEKALIRLLARKEYNKIFIKDICEEAGINRSSFYAHYADINDLMIQYEEKIAKKIGDIFKKDNEYNVEAYTKLFEFIKVNKIFYKAFLQTSDLFVERGMFGRFKNSLMDFARKNNYYFINNEMDYGFCFFSAGLKSICERWLHNNCKESPEEMAKLIVKEYSRLIK